LNVLPIKGDISATLLRRVEEYASIRAQWDTMSRCQVKYNTLVRDAFTTIRVDVQRTFPPPAVEALATWREYLTRVLRSYAVWNFDVRYTQGFSDVAVVLMAILVPEIGKLITLEASEALVFWCFAAFVERTASGLIAEDLMVMQAREIEEIIHITERFHPSCGQWLRDRNVGDLSFLVSALILAFARTFDSVVITRVWETLIASSAPQLFLRYFSSSLLILAFPSFQAMTSCNTGRLMAQADDIFKEQDIGNVIGLTLSLMKKSQAEIQTKNKIPERKNSELFEVDPEVQWLFGINMEYSMQYEAEGQFL
jgi:hypothetical protein